MAPNGTPTKFAIVVLGALSSDVDSETVEAFYKATNDFLYWVTLKRRAAFKNLTSNPLRLLLCDSYVLAAVLVPV